MTTQDHLKTNLLLAYPVMLSQLGQVMVGVADSLMVGKLGPVPLAAAALANAIFFFIMTFGLGVSFAITPMVAMADGAGDKKQCSNVLKHGMVVNMGLSVVLFAVIMITNRYLPHFGQEAGVVAQAGPYLTIIGFSIFPFLIFQSFRQFLEGLSLTRHPMVISIAMNVLNVILNYVFIYGKLGFPAMGLFGAGLATLIARTMMAIVIVIYVLFQKRFKKYRTELLDMKFERPVFREILHLGVPAGLQFTFEIGAFAFSAIMMGWISARAQAAHQIAINLASITYMAASGLAAAAAIRVGNQLGKGDLVTMRKAAMTLYFMVILFMSLCAIVLIIWRSYLPTIYISDPKVINIAAGLLIIAALFQLSDGAQVVGLGVLRGMKDVKIPMVITFISYWVVALPMGYLLAFKYHLGAAGLWYGLFSGLSIAAVLLFMRFKKRSKSMD